MSGLAPTAGGRRLIELDGLRGFALFGIMFANMTWFTGFAVASPEQRAALDTAALDAVVAGLVALLIDGRFWSLFALLFGYGIALQVQRLPRRRLVHRLLVLLVIGVAHAGLLWFGDIVSLYAVTGLFMLPFLEARSRTLLAWAGGLLLAPILINAGWLVADMIMHGSGVERADPGYGPAALLPLFATGTYTQSLAANTAFLVERWHLAVYTGRFPALLGLFVLGFVGGRHHVIGADGRRLAALLLIGLAIGLPAGVVHAFADVPLRPPSPGGLVLCSVRVIGLPALAIAWAAAVLLLMRRYRVIAALFAPAGRASLTIYVAQSLAGTILFYGWGLGWWGAIGTAWSVPLIVVIFTALSLVAAWWLRWFEQGPLEWLWRCGTYGRLLPLRAINQDRRPSSGPRRSGPSSRGVGVQAVDRGTV